MRKLIAVILLAATTAVMLLPTPAVAQFPGSFLSPSRGTDWSRAGSGGIPSRPTKCATLGVAGQVRAFAQSVTASQINSAISSCTSGQTVFLNPGTYSGLLGIDFSSKQNVTLDGADASLVNLVFSDNVACGGFGASVCLRSSGTSFPGGPQNTANWTAGYTQGGTSITLDSHTNLRVGSIFNLDQLADTDPTAVIKYTCDASASNCSLEGNGGNGNRNGRPQFQQVVVTGCGTTTFNAACTSNSITIDPPLVADNWTGAKSPGAFWASDPAYGSGVTNVTIDVTATNSGAITIFNCAYCFASGVAMSIGTGRSDIEVWNSSKVTISNSYFYGGQGASQSYGIATYGSSSVLAENDIFQKVTGPIIVQGCTGCVFGYPYTIWNYYTASSGFLNVSFMMHTAGIDTLLIDGAIGAQMYSDVFHGSHNLVLIANSRIQGNQPICATSGGAPTPCTGHITPIDVQSYGRIYSFVGNVLGQTGVHQSYENGTKSIWNYGEGNSEAGHPTVGSDAVVGQSMFRWGNCDPINGFNNCQFNASEVPTGLSSYAQTLPGSNTVPASFYYTSTPSWWPSGKPWPPIGPGVTGGNVVQCTSGTYSGAEVTDSSKCAGGTSSQTLGGHVYSNPAMDCYMNTMHGPPDGNGSFLLFSGPTCFQAASGPVLNVNTSSISYGNQAVGVASSSQSFTLTNVGTAPVTISGITVTGTNSADFALLPSHNCPISPSTLGVGLNCVVNVTFTPGAPGARSAFVMTASNDPNSPQQVAVGGTGTTAQVPTTSKGPVIFKQGVIVK